MTDTHLDRLDGLLPDVKEKALKFIALAQAEGIVLSVTQGLRTYAEQDALYSRGRATPGARVTNAPGGFSWHNFGRAFDVAIVSFPGDQTPKDLYDGPWERLGTLATRSGLEWGGHFPTPDSDHFEDRGGLTLAAARMAEMDNRA